MDAFNNEFDEKAKAWDDDPQHAKRAQSIAKAIREEIPLLFRLPRWNMVVARAS